MTLMQLLDEYFREQILRPETQRTYLYCVQSVIVFTNGDPPLESLSKEFWRRYRSAQLIAAKPITFNSKRAHLKVLLAFAVKRGYCLTNALAEVKGAPIYTTPKKIVADGTLTLALALLDGVEEPTLRWNGKYRLKSLEPRWFWRAVIFILYYTGMRRRQLVGLTWQDVDFALQAIVLSIETSKSKREWTIPMVSPVACELRQLHEQTCLALGQIPEGRAQVFCLPLFTPTRDFPSGRLEADYVTGWFCDLYQRLPPGQSRIGTHRLRHTTATRLARAEGNLKVVQQILGHTSIKTTLGYIHPDQNDMSRALSSLPHLQSQC
jgi:integrase